MEGPKLWEIKFEGEKKNLQTGKNTAANGNTTDKLFWVQLGMKYVFRNTKYFHFPYWGIYNHQNNWFLGMVTKYGCVDTQSSRVKYVVP